MENLYIIFKGFLDPIFIKVVLLRIVFFVCVAGSKKKTGYPSIEGNTFIRYTPQTKSLYKTIIALKEIVAQL
jgi:hypothetical protein